jgi:hypothetical protein
MIRGPRSNDLTERIALRLSKLDKRHAVKQSGGVSEYVRDLIAADRLGMVRLPVKLPMLLRGKR